ncbi:hypothetical protein NDU88_001153 [Pleurodeles waltl]|uniref:Uncharacterized protein n=1 Tax=Pleurodeles waltl TaxID=8319 RepID=A0AAV7MK79_PLEWA|nr:hypothetical protein NDU88_001153 [Pleurodeles waltl]
MGPRRGLRPKTAEGGSPVEWPSLPCSPEVKDGGDLGSNSNACRKMLEGMDSEKPMANRQPMTSPRTKELRGLCFCREGLRD